MLAVASLKRSLEFDPVEQGVKRKRAEMKMSPPSSPVSSSPSSSSTFSITNTNPSSPTKQQQPSIFTASPSKSSSLVLKKPCALTVLTSSSSSSSSTTDDIPMFNYTQAAQMCARLLREQDRTICEQYEELLSTKLTEQYDTFVRYTHDSVHKDQPKKQQQPRLFHFGQQQETNNIPTVAFSYVS